MFRSGRHLWFFSLVSGTVAFMFHSTLSAGLFLVPDLDIREKKEGGREGGRPCVSLSIQSISVFADHHSAQ